MATSTQSTSGNASSSQDDGSNTGGTTTLERRKRYEDMTEDERSRAWLESRQNHG